MSAVRAPSPGRMSMSARCANGCPRGLLGCEIQARCQELTARCVGASRHSAIERTLAGANGEFARGDHALVAARRRIDEERPAAADPAVEREQAPDVERPARVAVSHGGVHATASRSPRRSSARRRCVLHVLEYCREARTASTARRRVVLGDRRGATPRSGGMRPMAARRQLDLVGLVGGQAVEVGDVELGVLVALGDLLEAVVERLVKRARARRRRSRTYRRSISFFDGSRWSQSTTRRADVVVAEPRSGGSAAATALAPCPERAPGTPRAGAADTSATRTHLTV